MRPSTPVEAMAEALHRDRNSHVSSSCDESCATWVMDLREAEGLLESLGEVGWLVVPAVSLPESAPSRGPRTSDVAAESIDNLNDRQYAVHWLLSYYGPLTDEELGERYEGYEASARKEDYALGGVSPFGSLLPPQTPQSIRTRRKELVRAGHVVDTGQTRPTRSGRSAVVWAAVGSAEVAA